MNPTPTMTPTEQPDIQVSDIDQMVLLLDSWHANQVSVLAHLRELPEDTVLQIGDDLGDTLTLSGEVRRAFRLGIEMSLSHLGCLPYTAEAVLGLPVAIPDAPTTH